MGLVQVPAAQFSHGDFPDVCAMTGEHSETSRKFSFRTAPWWGVVLTGYLGADLFWPQVKGYLPLTNRADWRMTYGLWMWFAFIPVAFVFVLPSAFSASDWSPAKTVFFLIGLGSFLTGLTGIIRERRIRPIGMLLAGQVESRIEIRHVHPTFVAAVLQNQSISAPQIPLAAESK